MLGSVLSQQLTSRCTRTPLLTAAARSAVSSTGQYLGRGAGEGQGPQVNRALPTRPEWAGVLAGEETGQELPTHGQRGLPRPELPGSRPAYLAGWVKRVVGKYSITEA